MTCPYPGIRPFREDEQYLFFGREAQVDAMVDALARQRFLAVIGSSGSGKSSLVNCGLMPALHRGLLASAGSAWRMARCRPGGHPVRALAEALAAPGALGRGGPQGPFSEAELIESTLTMSRLGLVEAWRQAAAPPGTNLLLVVDQFEELFRYRAMAGAADEGGATEFVNLLLEARAHPDPIYVVLTMRSDFLGDCARFAGLPEAINGGQYLVPRMNRDERRQAIAGPARVFGAEIAPTLVTRLVNDVGDDPDQLSLLQHALARSWDHWQRAGASGAIGPEHYEAIGTLARALNQHAEEIYNALDAHAQQLCGAALRALTDKSTDARGIRRPTRFADLCSIAGGSADDLAAALAPLRAPGAAFLMPPEGDALQPDTIVDLSHESLMRLWDRLRDWGEREADSARMLRRLADARDLHAAGQVSLWRDPELQFALDWRERVKPGAPWAQQYGRELAPALAFLDASRAARDQAASQELERAAAEVRAESVRRRQRRALLLTISAVAAASVAALALATLWVRAERAAAVAESRQGAAQSGAQLGARNLSPALGLAAAAWRRQPSFEARDALLAALADAPRDWWRAGQQGVQALAHSPDGKLLASAGRDGSVKLWDAASGAALATLKGHAERVNALVFSPDGTRLLSGGADGSVQAWDVAQRQAVGPPMLGHGGAVQALAMSPDGQLLASAGVDQQILLRDPVGGAARGAPLVGHRDSVTDLAFSPDGSRLVSAGYDGALMLWAPGVSSRPLLSTSHGAALNQVAFSPDGELLATAAADRHVLLWNAHTLAPVGEPLAGHDAAVRNVVFTPDGATLVSTGDDRQVLLWNVAQRDTAPRALTPHDAAAQALSISPDGRQIVTGGAGDVLITQDLVRRGPQDTLLPGRAAWALAFSPDGRQLATAAADGSIVLRDAADGAARGQPLLGHTGLATGLAWRPDGGQLASAGQDGRVLLWTPGAAPQTLLQGAASMRVVRFSPDGSVLVAAGQDGRLRLWRVADGQPLAVDARLDGAVADLVFSPDGQRLLASGMNGELRLWDGTAARELQRLAWPAAGALYRASFSPDGRQVALATQKQGLLLWTPGADAAQALGQASQPVLDVAFAPDGGLLASADRDGAVRLWDTAVGQPLHVPLVRRGGPVLALAWSPDGRVLASSGWGRGVVLSGTGPDAWVELACTLVRRNPPRTLPEACAAPVVR